jgi:predicted nucleotidyltransferase
MQREDAINRLRGALPELRGLGVVALELFGSTARGDARPDSDVDVLVDLGPTPDWRRLVEAIEILERALAARVDVVTPGAVHPRLRRHLDEEGVRVA